MTAILETVAAVVVYWWIALKVGVVWPLLVSAAVAPMVLLRSDQSVALGLKWFQRAYQYPEELPDIGSEKLASLLGVLLLTLIVPPVAVAIRISATFLHLKHGIRALPGNFRRLILCTSPAQIPEIVPGIEKTDDKFRFSLFLEAWDKGELFDIYNSVRWQGNFSFIKYTFTSIIIFIIYHIVFCVLGLFCLSIILIIYLPAWLYRITIKSTAWFWWPLAFLGGDLKRAQNPALFHWKVLGSLWAKVSIVLASLSLLAFVAAHFHSLVLGNSELLVPVERLLLIDWKSLWSWQVCALLGSVLSLAVVFLINDVNGEYQIAQGTNNAKLLKAAQSKFGWIERLSRFRFLVFLAFWGLVGTHMVLYVNSQQCWSSLSSKLQEWAQDIYGDRLPRSKECPSADPSTLDH